MKKWILKSYRVVQLLLQSSLALPEKLRRKLQLIGIALGILEEVLEDQAKDKQEDVQSQ